MKEQQRVTLGGNELTKDYNKLDRLLKEGWQVVHMCPFSECVSLNYGDGYAIDLNPTSISGAYGVIFIVEREKTEEKN